MSSYFTVGVIGAVVFGSLLWLTIYALCNTSNKYPYRMFLFLIFFSALELPRYITFIMFEDYKEKISYVLHLVACISFFVAFSYVFRILQAAIYLTKEATIPPTPNSKLSLKHCTRLLWFEQRNLRITNSLFAVSAFVTAVSCLATSASLQDFIHKSKEYFAYTITELLMNSVFGYFLFVFGRGLLIRITTSVRLNGYESVGRFRRSIRNLTLLLVVCLFSFVLRSIMLILRLILVQKDAGSGRDVYFLSPFGLTWFLLSDILPKALPVLCFFYCFGYSPAKVRVLKLSVSDSSDFEDTEAFPYFDISGDDFNRPSQEALSADKENEGEDDELGKASFWSRASWLFSPKKSSRLTAVDKPLLSDINSEFDAPEVDNRESMTSENRLSEVSCRSTETVSVLTSFASVKDLLVNRSFNSRGISPALLSENSGSLSFADNSSNSLLNGSVTSHNGLNYPTPFIGKLVTNEYSVNGNHFTPGKLKASKSGRGSVLYNTLVWDESETVNRKSEVMSAPSSRDFDSEQDGVDATS